MKPRKYFYHSPEVVCHPSTTLREAAAVLDYDATLLAANGMKNEARSARHYAAALKAVASGSTWAQAFDLPEPIGTQA